MMFLAWFLGGIVLFSFTEYWSHRAMHAGWFLKKKHARHHQQRWGQGAVWEFKDYILPGLPFFWVGFLWSFEAGLGLVLADLCFCFFAGYAHQLQHERPQQVFWMGQPVHAVHHYHGEWHHNFGISTDLWDRVFGTYKAHEPLPVMGDPEAHLLDVHWFDQGPPLPKKPKAPCD